MRRWHARALEGLPGGASAWSIPVLTLQPKGGQWLSLPTAMPHSAEAWQASTTSSDAQAGMELDVLVRPSPSYRIPRLQSQSPLEGCV